MNRWHALAFFITAVVIALAGVLHYTVGVSATAFVIATIALICVAWLVTFATEAVGAHLGPQLAGVLQSTLGNVPEFFVVVFALHAGQSAVATSSLVGSVLANALLVLGLTIFVGAVRAPGHTMRFGVRLPNDTATLLLFSVFVIVLTAVVGDHGPASAHVDVIAIVAAICLIVVYVTWMFGYLHHHDPDPSAPVPAKTAPPEVAHLPLGASIALLATAGVAAAFVADWFVAGLDHAITSWNISPTFAGLVIVAIAGNAAENAAGVLLAYRHRTELALSVVKNSVSQVAAFLFPLLVLVSFVFATHLTFAMSPVLVTALALTAVVIWQITHDGEAKPFEGLALVALYVVLATVIFYQ